MTNRVMEVLESKFTSGNAIEVERSVILRTEWIALKEMVGLLTHERDLLKKRCDMLAVLHYGKPDEPSDEPNQGLNEHQLRAGYRSGKVADK